MELNACKECFKLLNAQLAVHYPDYTMVIKCIDELTLSMMFAARILTGRVKIMLIFISIKAIL